MSEFKNYRRKRITEMRPYVPGENMELIGIGEEARRSGSPKLGDMIARDPINHFDQWLVHKEFFDKQDFEEVK